MSVDEARHHGAPAGIDAHGVGRRARGVRADGRDALYARDFHIYVEGHRLVAEALVEPVLAAAPEVAPVRRRAR